MGFSHYFFNVSRETSVFNVFFIKRAQICAKARIWFFGGRRLRSSNVSRETSVLPHFSVNGQICAPDGASHLLLPSCAGNAAKCFT